MANPQVTAGATAAGAPSSGGGSSRGRAGGRGSTPGRPRCRITTWITYTVTGVARINPQTPKKYWASGRMAMSRAGCNSIIRPRIRGLNTNVSSATTSTTAADTFNANPTPP